MAVLGTYTNRFNLFSKHFTRRRNAWLSSLPLLTQQIFFVYWFDMELKYLLNLPTYLQIFLFGCVLVPHCSSADTWPNWVTPPSSSQSALSSPSVTINQWWSRYIAGSGLAWLARLNTKQIIAVSLETAMQNVGIAVLVLQVTKDGVDGYVYMVDARYGYCTSTFYQLWYPQSNLKKNLHGSRQIWILYPQVLYTSYDIHPQSNLESPYGDMALLSVIGYLLSRCFCVLRPVWLSVCFLFELSL